MFKIFLSSDCEDKEFDEFINKFDDGENLGAATFEFHNNDSFRIYIIGESEDNNILLFFNKK